MKSKKEIVKDRQQASHKVIVLNFKDHSTAVRISRKWLGGKGACLTSAAIPDGEGWREVVSDYPASNIPNEMLESAIKNINA